MAEFGRSESGVPTGPCAPKRGAVAGPDISYPPGFTSLLGAMACWCEMLALAAACTPCIRRRCKEFMCVVSLQIGVQLTTEDDSAATLSSCYRTESLAPAAT